jgi:ATP-dependent exoDNAse (exonuclease V) beta subunit
MTPSVESAAFGCFVEASAGTGKTHTLVTEIAAAIERKVPIDRIAAVTFTHAAAGLMKVRVRQELERRKNQGEALRSLDRAFIGTIHSFCAHLLHQRPVEARVDPDFGELDEANARSLFDGVFREWLAAKLNDPGPILRRALSRLAWSEERSAEGPVERLRDAAWRLAEWRDYDATWEIRDIDRRASMLALFERVKKLGAMLRVAKRATDPLARCLRPVQESRHRIRIAKEADAADPDDVENELLSLKFRIKYFDSNQGSGDWGNGVPRTQVIAAWRDLNDALEAFRVDADADLASRLRSELWQVVEHYQQAKRRSGKLDFQDLLISARDLLHHPEARRDLQDRYDCIFIDEFQDTDPLQAEILLSLCGNGRGDNPAQTGKLFVVGDPKQSIFRFRRADARQYRRIRDDLLAGGLGSRHLQEGRRSTNALHAFVNAAFADMPDALPLTGGVPSPETQPEVVALPIPYLHRGRYKSAKVAAQHAPDTTAAFVDWLIHTSNWTVRADLDNKRRPIRAEDVCILFRKTVGYRGADITEDYVRALEARGIEHVLVGSKSFHRREEIGTIRAALRAIEWPDDELSVYAVLRGALFFIPDSDLFKFRQQYGHLIPFFKPPDNLDVNFAPIAEILALLQKLHRGRNYRPPAETIRRLLDAARAHIGLAFHSGGERRLANVYRLCDLARGFEASRPGSFRSFIEFLDNEYELGEQSEAAVLEQQAGGVKLMTVHKAKGLEFPVVILADMTTHATQRGGCDRYVDTARRLCAQKLCTWAPWELRDNQDQEESEDRAESVRIGYVAATRAKDLLIVNASGMGPWEESWLTPVYGALYPEKDRWGTAENYPHLNTQGRATVLDFPPDNEDGVSVRPGMHRTAAGNRVFWFDPKMLPSAGQARFGLHRGEMLDGTEPQRQAGLAAWNQWRDTRADLIATASQPTVKTVLASKAPLTPEAGQIEFQVIAVDSEGQRPATRNFGRLVHALLESWDASAADRIAELHGRRIGATEREITAAAAAARAAMQHPLLNPARAVEVHREYPISVTLASGEIVEGVIDLAWSDGESWTVIDYKTGRAEAQYKTQVQLYALAIQRATGLPARAILLEV